MNHSHNQTKGRGLVPRLAPVGVCLFLAACALSPQQKHEQRLADTGAAAVHAVRGDRLSDVMKELNSLTSEQMRLPQEMDGTAARQQQADEVSRIAAKLADDAALLGNMLDETKIPEQDRPAFIGFAQKLRTEALALKTAADDDNLNAMNARLNAVITTCNACHSAFRGSPPPTAKH